MQSRDLINRIEIYKQVINRTPSGAVDINYVFKYSCRARINYSSGTRTIDNDEIFYSVDREFIVRSYVPIKETDEIRWNGQRWQILSIDRNRTYNDIVIKTQLYNE